MKVALRKGIRVLNCSEIKTISLVPYPTTWHCTPVIMINTRKSDSSCGRAVLFLLVVF